MREHMNLGSGIPWAITALLSLLAGSADAAPTIISAGKPVTITTNGAWEAGGYFASDVTDGDLSCGDLASSVGDGTVGWQNNDYNQLGVVNVTIDLGNTYTIDSIDYNMGNCMRASTWGADSITTPLGTFYPSPGSGSTGVWSSQTAADPVVASTITIQLSKTRTAWERDWMTIGEIRIWGELTQLPEPGPEAGPEPGPELGPEAGVEPGPEQGPETGPEPGPEPAPEPARDAGIDASIDVPVGSVLDGPVATITNTGTATSTVTTTGTSTSTVTTTTTTTTATGTSTATTGTTTTTGSSTVTSTAVGDAAPPVAIADAAAPNDGAAVGAETAAIAPTPDASGSVASDGGLALADAAASGTRDATAYGSDGGQTGMRDGSRVDGAVTPTKPSGGCGCVVGGGNTGPAGFWPLLVLGFLALRRGVRARRRRIDRD